MLDCARSCRTSPLTMDRNENGEKEGERERPSLALQPGRIRSRDALLLIHPRGNFRRAWSEREG